MNEHFKNTIEKNLVNQNPKENFFIPQWCFSDTEPCAIVLTSFYSDTKFFINHINEFKLKMRLYFLGDRLQQVISDIIATNEKISKTKQPMIRFLVLHWTPSEITMNPDLSFVNITMPECEKYINPRRECRYEVVPVKKFLNSEAMKSEGLEHFLKLVHFTSMEPILNIYHKFLPRIQQLHLNKKANKVVYSEENDNETLEEIYNECACQWLKENPQVYSLDFKAKPNDDETPETWIEYHSEDIEISFGAL